MARHTARWPWVPKDDQFAISFKLRRQPQHQPVSDCVPYAFEQRVLHALRALPPRDPALAWVAGLWRAALCSLAIATVAGGIHLTQPDDPTAPVEAVADSDLLEVATLGDLPGFEAPLPDTLRP